MSIDFTLLETTINKLAARAQNLVIFDKNDLADINVGMFMRECKYCKLELERLIGQLEALPEEMRKKLSTQMGILFMFACMEEDTILGQRLIENGADLNVKTSAGVDPFLAAVLTGNVRLQQVLIQHGAKPDALDIVMHDFKSLDAFPPHCIANISDFVHAQPMTNPSQTALDAAILSRRVGHTLGLTRNIPVGDGSITLEVGSNDCESSLRILSELIKGYRQSGALAGENEQDHFEKIEAAIKRSGSLLEKSQSNYSPDAHEKLCDDYHKGGLIYVASGFLEPPHAIGIALCGNYLVYCNRGARDESEKGESPSKIYKIPEGFNVTPEFIKSLMLANNKDPKSLKAALKGVKEPENVVVVLPHKTQRHQNCTFANSKGVIEGMLLLLENGNGDVQNLQKLANHYQDQENRSDYKNFTNYIRSHEIELVGKMAALAKTKEMKDFYVNLVKGFIAEHSAQYSLQAPRSQIKNEQEVARLITLVKILPQDIKEKILEILPNEIKNQLTNETPQRVMLNSYLSRAKKHHHVDHHHVEHHHVEHHQDDHQHNHHRRRLPKPKNVDDDKPKLK